MPALKESPGVPEGQDFVEWSTAQKSDAALKLVDLPDKDWKIPDYINEAVRALFPEIL